MIEIILPAMGEGIIEAEITRWLVKEGMHVDVDTAIVEVATDKVDSEIPASGSGTIHKILIKEGDTVKIGQVIALITTDGDLGATDPEPDLNEETRISIPEPERQKTSVEEEPEYKSEPAPDLIYKAVAFLSPLIRKLAMENEITPAELQGIKGSGTGGRITKEDLLSYINAKPESRQNSISDSSNENPGFQNLSPGKDLSQSSGESDRKEASTDMEMFAGKDISPGKNISTDKKEPQREFLNSEQIYGSDPYSVEEMERTRKLIADHMIYSKRVSPHVSSFVETDVTEMILWRNRVKDEFQEKHGQKLTLTTLILEAVAKALKQHPRINASVDGYNVILKQNINLGMATALPDGNLIVPVIHNADSLNLVGLAEKVNDLAERARDNRLLHSEIRGGTFTVTNMGQFNNIAGTPIINQPEVAILAVGAIVKKPAVVETPEGDTIGIRNILILTLSYDHRVVDGALGGSFLKTIGDHLQSFDPLREF